MCQLILTKSGSVFRNSARTLSPIRRLFRYRAISCVIIGNLLSALSPIILCPPNNSALSDSWTAQGDSFLSAWINRMQFYRFFMFPDAFFRMKPTVKKCAPPTALYVCHCHNITRYLEETTFFRSLINDIEFFFPHTLSLLSLLLSLRL